MSLTNTLAEKRVFISHASKNFPIADDIRRRLEELGLPCWIAPRDIQPGSSYGAEIVSAIENCLAVVLVLTSEANASRAVANELELAFRNQRVIIPVRLRPVSPASSLAFFVNNTQWVDVFHSPLKDRVSEIARLLAAVRNGSPPPVPSAEAKTFFGAIERQIEGVIRYKFLTLAIVLLGIAALGAFAAVFSSKTLFVLEAEQSRIDKDPATFGLVTLSTVSEEVSSAPTLRLRATTYVNIQDPVASEMSWKAFARFAPTGLSPIDVTPVAALRAPGAQTITFELPEAAELVVFCMTAKHPTLSGTYTARWDFVIARSASAVSITRSQAPRIEPTKNGDCE